MKRLLTFRGLLLFILGSLILFFPSYRYGFVTDFLSWLHKYEGGSYADVITCFGYNGLHQFFHLINYSIYRLFEFNQLGWYFCFSVLHGFNGYMLFRVLYRILDDRHVRLAAWVSILTSACFMIGPYQIEAVVWKACFHYLMSFGLFISAVYFLLLWLERSSYLHLFAINVLFILSLFTLELNLAWPFMLMTLALVLNHFLHAKRIILILFLPQVVLLASYFLANKLMLGDWVGHYGADQHLNFDFVLMVGNGFRYLSKYLLFGHHWNIADKLWWYGLFHSYLVVLIGLGFTGILLVVWIVKYSKSRIEIHLAGMSLLIFFMFLFPIVNLFFSHILFFENDRYGYCASAFFYFSVLLLLSMLPSYFSKLAMLAYSGVVMGLGMMMIFNTYQAGRIQHDLLDNLGDYGDKKVVFLSKADNYRGLILFRDVGNRGKDIPELLHTLKGRSFTSEITDVAQFNMLHDSDATDLTFSADGRLQVMIGTPGVWFWKEGIGLNNTETVDYQLELYGWYYLLKWKGDTVDIVFLYQQGTTWKSYEFPD